MKILGKVGNQNNWVVYDICPTLRGLSRMNNIPRVLVSPKLTNTQSKFISTNLTTKTMETSQKSTQANSQTSTSSAVDSLVRHFLSLENEKDLKIPEGHYSLKLREYCEINNLDYSSLKMLKDCLVTTTAILSEPSSPRLQNWGMTYNGKCLTAKISESPRIGKECSLSDILEEQVDQKYFLSEKAVETILKHSIRK